MILRWTYIVITTLTWDTKMYISFPFQSCRSKYACLGSTRNHSIIYYSTMREKKCDFFLRGLNAHKIIFTISFVWVDILLFSLMLDVVFFFQLVLVIREYTNNARKKSRFSQYYNFFTRMSFEESDHHVIFSKKIYLLK